MTMRDVGFSLLLLASGCATGQAHSRGDEPLIAEGHSGSPAPRAHSDTRPPEIAGPLLAAGTISRDDLVKVLDQGPARFFGQLEVRARLHKRRFIGWEVVAFRPQDKRMARVDLLPGDIIRRVNGRVVSRPEQFQKIWDSLRFARRLRVNFTRGGKHRELVFTIQN